MRNTLIDLAPWMRSCAFPGAGDTAIGSPLDGGDVATFSAKAPIGTGGTYYALQIAASGSAAPPAGSANLYVAVW
jgi:hypothetical protein